MQVLHMSFPQQSEDQIRKFFESSRTFYQVKIDTKGNYAYMNRYFLDKYATFYKGTGDEPAVTALHPDDYDKSYQTYLNCCRAPDKSFEVTLKKLDGKGGYIITHWEFKANVLDDGTTDGVVGVGYDITAFESRQDHIRFLTSTLSDVAYKQSHLIRRPLANILGLIELAGEEEDVASLIAMLKLSCKELEHEFNSFLVPYGESEELTALH